MFQGLKAFKIFKIFKKRKSYSFMKIAYVFAKAQLFDFTSLRQGQFLANDGEKAEKADFKKHRVRTHRGYFFTTVQNSYSRP